MSNDRRLVYSSEDGQIAKAMEHNPSGSRQKRKQKPSPSAPAIKTPGKQGIRIRRESKGRGGKNVCVIDGIQLDESGLKQLLKKLKGQLGCGGSIKGNSIEIQGDHREKLLQLLESEGMKAKLAGG